MERYVQRVLAVVIVAFAVAVQADAQTATRTPSSSERPGTNVSASTSRPPSVNAPAAPLAQSFSVRDFVRQNVDENAGRENLRKFQSSLFQTTKTPFMTQSRLPLGRAFGSRLQFNFDMTSTNNKNLIMGPLVPAQTTETAFAQARTDDRYGISLSVPLGRGAESSASKGLLWGLSRALHRK
jgi:hypothetical protein